MAVKAKEPALSAPVTPIPNQFGMLVNLGGFLAVYIGDRLCDDKPARELMFRKSGNRIDDWTGPMVGEVLAGYDKSWLLLRGREIQFPDWASWEHATVEQEIVKPKDGKEHGWVWDPSISTSRVTAYSQFGWRRVDWPRCKNCHDSWYETAGGRNARYSAYHDPSFVYVEDCDRCHPGGVCNRKGICAPRD